MVIPSLVQEIFLSPLYQLLSYYYAFQGGIPLFSIITALDTLIRLIACGVFFAAAAGLIACSYNCRRKMVLPMAFYIALHAVNKLFAFLTVYLLTLFGLSDFTMSMLGAAMPTLFTYAAWDLAARRFDAFADGWCGAVRRRPAAQNKRAFGGIYLWRFAAGGGFVSAGEQYCLCRRARQLL